MQDSDRDDSGEGRAGEVPPNPSLADRALVEQLAKRITALAEELASSSTQLMENIVDDLDTVAIAKRLDDVNEIVFKREVIVREESCPRCNRLQGEPHKLGSCINAGRVEEIRARLSQV
jgi:hypothetical protein